jgi:hypothetical protein
MRSFSLWQLVKKSVGLLQLLRTNLMTLVKLSNGPKLYQGRKKTRANFVADFETTTDPNDCRVWAWGMCHVDDADNVSMGNNIKSFIDHASKFNSTIYFHNLKFDGHFIIYWLLTNGYIHTTERNVTPGTFNTVISDMGKFYAITVRWRNGTNTEFRDSLKKLPMSVRRIAKSFELDEGKGEIDYHAHRPVGHKITAVEADYLRRDVSIVAKAMKEVIDAGMNRLTVASDSLAEYKKLSGDKHFTRLFPVLAESMDDEIRRAYRGGFTYADNRYKGSLQRSGLVLDVNSLYPSVMMNCVLPYGEPEFSEDIVIASSARPLTIFSVTFTAKLKPNHIPCIQIKGTAMFGATEYLKEIKNPVTLMVTNVDWALYNDHYNIQVLAWGGGWLFHAAQGMFDTYINKWSAVKIASQSGKREIAKLHLNALYGKFASNPNVTSKIPTLKDGAVKLVRGVDEKRPPIYTAVGVFITSFARDLTIRAAQENYDTFAYADTDSLHLLQDELPTNIEVHPSKLGAWKLEYKFDAAFYIRAKAYLERKTDGEYVNRIAGLPELVSGALRFEDLVDGKILHGKLHPKSVPGGVVLKDVPFELKL